MADSLFAALWKESALVAILIVIIYTGHKGFWFWSPGVRALTTELARERDDWRALAVTMMRKQGIDLPEGFEAPSEIVLPGYETDQRKSGR